MRDFRPDHSATDARWCGDITYLAIDEGWLYLATVIDIASRRVVGWATADHLRTELVADALRAACHQRRPDGPVPKSSMNSYAHLNNPMLHRPVELAQYGSRAFAGLCDQLGVTRSVGAVGTSADNAACESFHASLKRETGARDYGDAGTCRRTVFAWLTRYNTRRRHSANGHLSPNEYEHRHHTAKLTLAA
ncbi:DDE-type integrase/transposase/recombinase [Streptomyces sp. NPDC006739]|uniref:DDE-type integrase/transposase/recombinase n=1 Tax=Streptomyces sp. NPDC006739 TaxID=3364763 RepID=UPI0036D1914B